MPSAQNNFTSVSSFRLITLDPGHFHAALVQKSMYPGVDAEVHVYAPGGTTADDLTQHLNRIHTFNTRPETPTHWKEIVYTGPDYLEKMLAEKAGNVVIIAGNSARRTDYLLRCLQAGLNVLADKPMAICMADFAKLGEAFATAGKNQLLLYDIMTERHEVTTIVQRELSRDAALFGAIVPGSAESPAISMASTHHFSKIVGGMPLKRPAWFFDIRQQGEGIIDVTTHLVDLIQWIAFPEQALAPADVRVASARRWPTPITPAQFLSTTGHAHFPDFLQPDVKESILQVYANGEFTYQLRGIWCHVKVVWNFQAATGGDTHTSCLRGTLAQLFIKQGPEQSFKPTLTIEKTPGVSVTDLEFETRLNHSVESLQGQYPGIGWQRDGHAWRITIPEKYDVGHEAHFAQVTRAYLQFLREGRLPEWEIPNMITKYETLRQAYELSR